MEGLLHEIFIELWCKTPVFAKITVFAQLKRAQYQETVRTFFITYQLEHYKWLITFLYQ